MELVVGSTNIRKFPPINTLSYIEKKIELIVCRRLEYINDNNMLIINQFEFRANHSCEPALQLTITNWKQPIESFSESMTNNLGVPQDYYFPNCADCG